MDAITKVVQKQLRIRAKENDPMSLVTRFEDEPTVTHFENIPSFIKNETFRNCSSVNFHQQHRCFM